jgi:peptidoglycan hydrolase-like protein with peptidoglycan-binding domain
MAIQRGSSGPDVRQLQEQLSRLGFYAGKLDADFGGQTDLAVKDFQRRLGLVPDGKIGPITNQAISSTLGGNVPGGTSFFKSFSKSRMTCLPRTPPMPSISLFWIGGLMRSG